MHSCWHHTVLKLTADRHPNILINKKEPQKNTRKKPTKTKLKLKTSKCHFWVSIGNQFQDSETPAESMPPSCYKQNAGCHSGSSVRMTTISCDYSEYNNSYISTGRDNNAICSNSIDITSYPRRNNLGADVTEQLVNISPEVRSHASLFIIHCNNAIVPFTYSHQAVIHIFIF